MGKMIKFLAFGWYSPSFPGFISNEFHQISHDCVAENICHQNLSKNY